MKLRPLLAIGTIAAITSACTPVKNFFARQDFQKLCTLAQEFPWDKYSEEQAPEMAVDFYESVDKKLSADYFRNAWKAASLASLDQRYPLLQQGAKEVGLENYDCPPLKDYMEGRKPNKP